MRKNNLWHKLGLIIIISLISIIIFALFSPNFFSQGMTHGGDEAAHMFIPKYVVDYYKIHRHIPIINPYWYNGIETLHNAPSLDYIPIAAIYLVAKDIYLTNRIFTFLLLWLAGLSIFYLLYKRNNVRSAIIGSILYPFTPGIFYLARSSVTRVTPFILLPLAFYFSDEILEKNFRFRNFLILTLIMAAMILSHPVTGLGSIIFLGFYVFIRIVIDRKISSNKLWVWFGSLFLASGLSAWFAIPFLLEPSNYSYPAGGVATAIKTIKVLDMPILAGGIIFLILGLISFWQRRTEKDWALFVSLIFALFCVSPLSYPIYALFPWGYPFSAFIWICIVSLYFGTSFFEFAKLNPKIAKGIALLAVPLLITIGLISYNRYDAFLSVWVEPYDKSFSALNDAFGTLNNPGRVFDVKPASKLDWMIPAINKKYSSEGHYFSITRLNKEIGWMNDAFNNGYYAYMINRMNLFNDRYFVYTMYAERFFNNNPDLKTSFDQELKKDGYIKYSSSPDEAVRAVYYKDKPSQYLIPLKEQTLVIGYHGYNYAAFQPNSYIAGSIYLDDYDLEFIKNFDNLVLYGFGYHDKAKAEKLIGDYARGGGNVVIDMLNVESSKLESEPTFLGVHSTLSKTNSPMQLEFAQNVESNILPKTLEIPSTNDFGLDELGTAKPVPLNEWRFTEYSNLDSSMIRWQNRIDPDDGLNNLVGYKNIDGHKVWFVGGNLFYHAYLTHNSVEQKFLRQITTVNSKPASLSNIDISSQNLDPEAGKMEFSYKAQEATPLLVSYTISPHWKAYLNGQPIKIYNLDSMMAVNLPAGENYVTLKYENLPDHYLAIGTTVASLIILGIIFFANLKRKKAKKDV